MIQITDMTYRIAGRSLFENASATVPKGHKIGLIGRNGCGKSTLLKLLTGDLHPDAGSITINGIKDAKNGIGTVSQEAPGGDQTPLDFVLSADKERADLIERAEVEDDPNSIAEIQIRLADIGAYSAPAKAAIILAGLGFDNKAQNEPLSNFSGGWRMRVAIAALLLAEPDVLLLDEPTSLLTPSEADQLFIVLRAMADDGKGIVFISHKMREVFAVSDRVTVLKLGKTQGTCHITETNEDELTRRTFGETVPNYMERPPVAHKELALNTIEMVPSGLDKKTNSKGISLKIRRGEIMGLAGVSGNGQTELIEAVTGLVPPASGEVWILNADMTGRTPKEFIEHGVAHIPERRREIGIVEQMYVAENVVLKDYRKTPFSKNTVLRHQQISSHADKIVEKFNALVPDLWQTECRILSGGNIQRLILGRETWRKPPVIIASHPTEGLDAKAIRHTWELFLALRAEGSAVLLVSEDLDEIMSLSDRIAVMFDGKIMGTVDGKGADREILGHWMAGGTASAA